MDWPFLVVVRSGVGELLWRPIRGISVVFWVGNVTKGLVGMVGEGVKRSLLMGVWGEEIKTGAFLLAFNQLRSLETLLRDVGFWPLALSQGP